MFDSTFEGYINWLYVNRKIVNNEDFFWIDAVVPTPTEEERCDLFYNKKTGSLLYLSSDKGYIPGEEGPPQARVTIRILSPTEEESSSIVPKIIKDLDM